MNDKLFDHIVTQWETVFDLPPQKVGKFTPWYKSFTKRLKVMPLPFLLLLSILLVILLYFFFGPSIIYIVETLQRGF